MNLVDKVNLTIALTKLVLGINEDESALGGNLLSASEDLAGVVLHDSVVLGRNDALSDNLFLRDVHVVTLVGLGCWSDDRLRETLVLLHAVGQLNAAQLATAVLILTPSRTGKD